MSPRIFTIVAASTLSLTGFFTPTATAQDAVQSELKALRQSIEAQAQKIETLSAQVARLSAQLDGRTASAPAVAPATDPALVSGGDFSPPAAPPKPANVHIVVKGDSLEKIAKEHNTTAMDLQKINKITDPKKLQIGQQLLLPPSTQKGQ